MLTIADKTFHSRLLLGTSRYRSPKILLDCIRESGAEIITVAIRRVNLQQKENTFLDEIDLKKYHLLPNTAGCYTAKDATLTAELAREALNTNWVKLEVIADEETLLPNAEELLKASAQLIKNGFIVLPYANDDVVVCKKLEEMGCAAVMPLAAPIGSGLGIRNPHTLELIRREIKVPLVVDAGIGTASDAARAMEMGYDGILLNTAVAEAKDSVLMARAMRLAIESGRAAYEAGRIPMRHYAQASSPMEGMIGKN